jgi:putative acetyltransferase
MDIVIRPEMEKDYEAITAVNDLAFGGTNEGRLIQTLRKTPEFLAELSLVASDRGIVIGHILFYPVAIVAGTKRHRTLALAPMCVHPAYQQKGVGNSLVEEGCSRAKDRGFTSVIALGHSGYYLRFGFKPAYTFGIRAPFDVPPDTFMAMELAEGALAECHGIVDYPKPYCETL